MFFSSHFHVSFFTPHRLHCVMDCDTKISCAKAKKASASVTKEVGSHKRRELVGLRDIQSGAAEDWLRKPVNILRDGVDVGIFRVRKEKHLNGLR